MSGGDAGDGGTGDDGSRGGAHGGEGGGGEGGVEGGEGQNGSSLAYPATMKLRPVVQQARMAKRTCSRDTRVHQSARRARAWIHACVRVVLGTTATRTEKLERS